MHCMTREMALTQVLCPSKEAIQALPLRPPHWMRTFFTTHALIDLQDNKLGLQVCSWSLFCVFVARIAFAPLSGVS